MIEKLIYLYANFQVNILKKQNKKTLNFQSSDDFRFRKKKLNSKVELLFAITWRAA